MRINLSIDNTRLESRLKKSAQRIAYDVVGALNDTAKKIQQAERQAVRRELVVRDPSDDSFLMRQTGKIKPFASVGKAIPYVEISIEQKGRLILPELETGGERRPWKGRRVAVPIIGHAARPSFQQAVPQAFQIGRLHFTKTKRLGAEPVHGRRRRSKKSGGAAVRFGGQGTYLIPDVGVFRRVDSKRSELLYAFLQHERLPRKIHFEDVADQTARIWFEDLLDRRIAATLARHANE